MDYDQFTQKFEEMEGQMGPLSAFTNYQLQNAIVWGFVWSLGYLPIQITNFINFFLEESNENSFFRYTVYIFIYLFLIVGANIIFHFRVKKLNHQFLQDNSIAEVVILYLFPFCPLCVVFYVTIFEMLLRTCKYYINILFHWFASIAMMIAFYVLSTEINFYIFFLNMVMMDIFSILIAYENGKIINPINNLSFVQLFLIVFLSFYGFYWIFAIHPLKQFLSMLLYALNAVLIYFHLKRQIYPLYGNTPIHIFILNKVIPFTLNILLSLYVFK